MTKENIKRRSKLLSLILRHKPEKAGLELGEGGWVAIDDLMAGLSKLGKPTTFEQIQEVVETNDKKRFTISKDGKSIRAAQGHSIKVDLGLKANLPPEVLYHGTASRFMKAIGKEGLRTMNRDHVHLSTNVETATNVAMRYGLPVILKVDAHGLHATGQEFYEADNGVWLTGPIAPNWFVVTKEA